jgi:hypothetical protein
MISWFYAYVEHIEIKTKTVNIIHFPYLPHRTQLRTHLMILTFDNKFDQIDEADCMFIFQINHQYSFGIIVQYTTNLAVPM